MSKGNDKLNRNDVVAVYLPTLDTPLPNGQKLKGYFWEDFNDGNKIDHGFWINDLYFEVPPERISSQEENNFIASQAIRSNNTYKIPASIASEIFTISLNITHKNAIRNIDTRDDKGEVNNSGKRGGVLDLIHQFKHVPFACIENAYLRTKLKIPGTHNMVFCMHNLALSTSPGEPNVLVGTLTISPVAYTPYSDRWLFKKKWMSNTLKTFEDVNPITLEGWQTYVTKNYLSENSPSQIVDLSPIKDSLTEDINALVSPEQIEKYKNALVAGAQFFLGSMTGAPIISPKLRGEEVPGPAVENSLVNPSFQTVESLNSVDLNFMKPTAGSRFASESEPFKIYMDWIHQKQTLRVVNNDKLNNTFDFTRISPYGSKEHNTGNTIKLIWREFRNIPIDPVVADHLRLYIKRRIAITRLDLFDGIRASQLPDVLSDTDLQAIANSKQAQLNSRDWRADSQFLEALDRVCFDLDVAKEDLLAVMSRESGISPSALNPGSKAAGLIQFMPFNAKAFGTTTAKILKMTRAEQMVLVKRYFIGLGLPKKASAAEIYGYVFQPRPTKNAKGPDFVLVQKGQGAYDDNAGLDHDRDGKITLKDLQDEIRITGAAQGLYIAPYAGRRSNGYVPGGIGSGSNMMTLPNTPPYSNALPGAPPPSTPSPPPGPAPLIDDGIQSSAGEDSITVPEVVRAAIATLPKNMNEAEKGSFTAYRKQVEALLDLGWNFYDKDLTSVDLFYKEHTLEITSNGEIWPADYPDPIVCDFISGTCYNSFKRIPIQGVTTQTAQFLGRQDNSYLISFKGNGLNSVKKLEIIKDCLKKQAVLYKYVPEAWALRVENNLINAFGDVYFVINGLETSTIPEQPGSHAIEMRLTGHDIYIKESKIRRTSIMSSKKIKESFVEELLDLTNPMKTNAIVLQRNKTTDMVELTYPADMLGDGHIAFLKEIRDTIYLCNKLIIPDNYRWAEEGYKLQYPQKKIVELFKTVLYPALGEAEPYWGLREFRDEAGFRYPDQDNAEFKDFVANVASPGLDAIAPAAWDWNLESTDRNYDLSDGPVRVFAMSFSDSQNAGPYASAKLAWNGGAGASRVFYPYIAAHRSIMAIARNTWHVAAYNRWLGVTKQNFKFYQDAVDFPKNGFDPMEEAAKLTIGKLFEAYPIPNLGNAKKSGIGIQPPNIYTKVSFDGDPSKQDFVLGRGFYMENFPGKYEIIENYFKMAPTTIVATSPQLASQGTGLSQGSFTNQQLGSVPLYNMTGFGSGNAMNTGTPGLSTSTPSAAPTQPAQPVNTWGGGSMGYGYGGNVPIGQPYAQTTPTLQFNPAMNSNPAGSHVLTLSNNSSLVWTGPNPQIFNQPQVAANPTSSPLVSAYAAGQLASNGAAKTTPATSPATSPNPNSIALSYENFFLRKGKNNPLFWPAYPHGQNPAATPGGPLGGSQNFESFWLGKEPAKTLNAKFPGKSFMDYIWNYLIIPYLNNVLRFEDVYKIVTETIFFPKTRAKYVIEKEQSLLGPTYEDLMLPFHPHWNDNEANVLRGPAYTEPDFYLMNPGTDTNFERDERAIDSRQTILTPEQAYDYYVHSECEYALADLEAMMQAQSNLNIEGKTGRGVANIKEQIQSVQWDHYRSFAPPKSLLSQEDAGEVAAIDPQSGVPNWENVSMYFGDNQDLIAPLTTNLKDKGTFTNSRMLNYSFQDYDVYKGQEAVLSLREDYEMLKKVTDSLNGAPRKPKIPIFPFGNLSDTGAGDSSPYMNFSNTRYPMFTKVKDAIKGLGRKKLAARRAYPAVKVYFIEEDDIYNKEYVELDEVYTYSQVESIEITESRKRPASLCKIVFVDPHGILSGFNQWNKAANAIFTSNRATQEGKNNNTNYSVDTEASNPFVRGTEYEQSSVSFKLRPGLKIKVCLGFSNDPNKLEEVFLGEISDVGMDGSSERIEVLAMGYGAELVAKTKGINEKEAAVSYNDTFDLLAHLMFEPEVIHFGRKKFDSVSMFTEDQSIQSNQTKYKETFANGAMINAGKDGGFPDYRWAVNAFGVGTGVEGLVDGIFDKWDKWWLESSKIITVEPREGPQDDNIFAPNYLPMQGYYWYDNFRRWSGQVTKDGDYRIVTKDKNGKEVTSYGDIGIMLGTGLGVIAGAAAGYATASLLSGLMTAAGAVVLGVGVAITWPIALIALGVGFVVAVATQIFFTGAGATGGGLIDDYVKNKKKEIKLELGKKTLTEEAYEKTGARTEDQADSVALVSIVDPDALKYNIFYSTIWDVLEEMTYRHPGYVKHPRIYYKSNRMTMFFGLPDQNMWECAGDPIDTIQANKLFLDMAKKAEEDYQKNYNVGPDENFYHTKDGKVIALARKTAASRERVNEIIDNAGKKGSILVDGKKLEDFMRYVRRRFKPFRRWHNINSYTDIISNEIEATSDGWFTEVQINYSYVTSGDSEAENAAEDLPGDLTEVTNPNSLIQWNPDRVVTKRANVDLQPHNVRSTSYSFVNCKSIGLAKTYARSILSKQARDMYKGSLTILGNPYIRPYDVCMVADTYNNIYGPIEVEEVTHIISPETGYVTVLQPDTFIVQEDVTPYVIMNGIRASLQMRTEYYAENTLAAYPKWGDLQNYSSEGRAFISELQMLINSYRRQVEEQELDINNFRKLYFDTVGWGSVGAATAASAISTGYLGKAVLDAGMIGELFGTVYETTAALTAGAGRVLAGAGNAVRGATLITGGVAEASIVAPVLETSGAVLSAVGTSAGTVTQAGLGGMAIAPVAGTATGAIATGSLALTAAATLGIGLALAGLAYMYASSSITQLILNYIADSRAFIMVPLMREGQVMIAGINYGYGSGMYKTPLQYVRQYWMDGGMGRSMEEADLQMRHANIASRAGRKLENSLARWELSWEKTKFEMGNWYYDLGDVFLQDTLFPQGNATAPGNFTKDTSDFIDSLGKGR